MVRYAPYIYPKYDAVNMYITTDWYHAPHLADNRAAPIKISAIPEKSSNKIRKFF